MMAAEGRVALAPPRRARRQRSIPPATRTWKHSGPRDRTGRLPVGPGSQIAALLVPGWRIPPLPSGAAARPPLLGQEPTTRALNSLARASAPSTPTWTCGSVRTTNRASSTIRIASSQAQINAARHTLVIRTTHGGLCCWARGAATCALGACPDAGASRPLGLPTAAGPRTNDDDRR